MGCNNPKVIYERAIVDVAEEMLKNNILILTNGCASFPLLKLGFCHPDARSKCGEGLRRFLDEGYASCLAHGRMYRQHQSQRRVCRIANVLGQRITDMPYAMSSPLNGAMKRALARHLLFASSVSILIIVWKRQSTAPTG